MAKHITQWGEIATDCVVAVGASVIEHSLFGPLNPASPWFGLADGVVSWYDCYLMMVGYPASFSNFKLGG